MRNAAASFDEDYDRPAPKRSAAKPRSPRNTKQVGIRLKVDFKRLAKISALGLGAIVSLVIMVNALTWQKQHHPAPLFGKVVSLRQAAAIAAPAPTKTQTVKTESVSAPDATASIPSPALDSKPRHAAASASSDKSVGGDQIARLLGGAPVRATSKTDSKTVLGVQRALVKLHLLPKATGTMGPATKKAIVKFEKDKHMPVKGEMNSRLVKVLSAESGVKID